MLRVLDLFSGIGGFSLGLERTGGFETVAFCEIEEFPRRVLAKHWPGVPIYNDIRELTADRLAADGIAVDVICGGFPCQDISFAGKGAGLGGERSGLFHEVARLVRELGPKILILENVAALLSRGIGEVLGTLAEIGYDAEWECIPAGAVGAPHIRDRFWLVGYPNDQGQSARAEHDETPGLSRLAPDTHRISRWPRAFQGGRPGVFDRAQIIDSTWWVAEPPVARVAHGVPRRVDRTRALGNAVVPQIPELIGRAILAARAGTRVAARPSMQFLGCDQ